MRWELQFFIFTFSVAVFTILLNASTATDLFESGTNPFIVRSRTVSGKNTKTIYEYALTFYVPANKRRDHPRRDLTLKDPNGLVHL
jgi:hypothetical protein